MTGFLEKPVTMSLREGGGRMCLTEERGTIFWLADYVDTPGANDYLDGGADADALLGGAGDDILLGGDGR